MTLFRSGATLAFRKRDGGANEEMLVWESQASPRTFFALQAKQTEENKKVVRSMCTWCFCSFSYCLYYLFIGLFQNTNIYIYIYIILVPITARDRGTNSRAGCAEWFLCRHGVLALGHSCLPRYVPVSTIIYVWALLIVIDNHTSFSQRYPNLTPLVARLSKNGAYQVG